MNPDIDKRYRASEAYETFLKARRAEICERIAAAAARAGRQTDEITLLAVSKTVDVPELVSAHLVGYEIFGENRPQELRRKRQLLAEVEDLEPQHFHMIGNLQKNKINQVLDANVELIHSVASRDLAQALSKRAAAREKNVSILLEVNVSGEQTKAGMSVLDALMSAEEIAELPALSLTGLMTMAPVDNGDEARRSFSGLRELRDRLVAQTGLALPVLSCGMSGDFEIAVEEGATLLRLGRVVFSPDFTLDDKH